MSAPQMSLGRPCTHSVRSSRVGRVGRSGMGAPQVAVAPVRGRRAVTQSCGVVGIALRRGRAALEAYEGLMMLQHRGQDSAGIVTLDAAGGAFRERKDNGLVTDVFDEAAMAYLEGEYAIGHVRYPTQGSSSAAEAQPFFVNAPFGIYLIHNGNLTDTEALRETVKGRDTVSYRRQIRTLSDSEVLLNVFADEVHRSHRDRPQLGDQSLVFEACKATMQQAKGAYSVILLINGVGLLAFRDEHGIRPLSLAKRVTDDGEDEWMVASEDVSFATLGYTKVREVNPGEAVLIDLDGKLHSEQCLNPKPTPCIFEYVYMARPDSVLTGISVYQMHLELGQRLAKRIQAQMDHEGLKIDCVVPVPDAARSAAIEVAKCLNLPYREGLVKNRYVGRTFIMPDQRMREKSVRRKLNAMSEVFSGKNVLLVDDSIVRGTTMRQIIEMCRNAGASKVYMASLSPPVRYPNVYGVDMPSKRELVAGSCDEGECEIKVCEVLRADGLYYQTLEDLVGAARAVSPDPNQQFDCSCFDGVYVTGDVDAKYLADLEEKGRGSGRATLSEKAMSLSSRG